MMHTTADDPTKYRLAKEVDEWWVKDPLSRFKVYLTKKGIWNDELQTKQDAGIKAEIDEQVKLFEAWKPERMDTHFDLIYSKTYPETEEQRAEFLANMNLIKESQHG